MTAETAGAGSLTAYVAGFAASTRFAGIPGDVVELGKKSILDGLGLVLAGSVAESGGRSGKDLLTAYHVGVEVECKIAEAINPRHYQHGFHSTATCGTFAAAAGVANLSGLDPTVTRTALGIAGSLSAGLRENFGTMMKPFHAGRAAESGVLAAEFASMGYTATPYILEAPRGFFRAAGGGYDEASEALSMTCAIAPRLGVVWYTFQEEVGDEDRHANGRGGGAGHHT